MPSPSRPHSAMSGSSATQPPRPPSAQLSQEPHHQHQQQCHQCSGRSYSIGSSVMAGGIGPGIGVHEAMLNRMERLEEDLEHSRMQSLGLEKELAQTRGQLEREKDDATLLKGQLQRLEGFHNSLYGDMMKEWTLYRRLTADETTEIDKGIKCLVTASHSESYMPEEIRLLKEELATLEKQNGQLRARIQVVEKQHEAQLEEVQHDARTTIHRLESQIAGLNEALSNMKGPAVLARLRSWKRTVFELKEGLFGIRQSLFDYRRHLQQYFPGELASKAVSILAEKVDSAREDRSNTRKAMNTLREGLSLILRDVSSVEDRVRHNLGRGDDVSILLTALSTFKNSYGEQQQTIVQLKESLLDYQEKAAARSVEISETQTEEEICGSMFPLGMKLRDYLSSSQQERNSPERKGSPSSKKAMEVLLKETVLFPRQAFATSMSPTTSGSPTSFGRSASPPASSTFAQQGSLSPKSQSRFEQHPFYHPMLTLEEMDALAEEAREKAIAKATTDSRGATPGEIDDSAVGQKSTTPVPEHETGEGEGLDAGDTVKEGEESGEATEGEATKGGIHATRGRRSTRKRTHTRPVSRRPSHTVDVHDSKAKEEPSPRQFTRRKQLAAVYQGSEAVVLGAKLQHPLPIPQPSKLLSVSPIRTVVSAVGSPRSTPAAVEATKGGGNAPTLASQKEARDDVKASSAGAGQSHKAERKREVEEGAPAPTSTTESTQQQHHQEGTDEDGKEWMDQGLAIESLFKLGHTFFRWRRRLYQKQRSEMLQRLGGDKMAAERMAAHTTPTAGGKQQNMQQQQQQANSASRSEGISYRNCCEQHDDSALRNAVRMYDRTQSVRVLSPRSRTVGARHRPAPPKRFSAESMLLRCYPDVTWVAEQRSVLEERAITTSPSPSATGTGAGTSRTPGSSSPEQRSAASATPLRVRPPSAESPIVQMTTARPTSARFKV